MNEENQVTQEAQTEQPQSQEETVDYKALYLDEVQNAKKLRKRSQDVEARLSDITKKQETQKVKDMQEQERYKELYESAAPYKEKWESFESKRKDSLLAKLPEADRERMSNKDIDTLEYIVSKIDEAKPATQEPVSGVSRNIKDMPDENIFAMSPEDRKKYWGSHMENIMNKKT